MRSKTPMLRSSAQAARVLLLACVLALGHAAASAAARSPTTAGAAAAAASLTGAARASTGVLQPSGEAETRRRWEVQSTTSSVDEMGQYSEFLELAAQAGGVDGLLASKRVQGKIRLNGRYYKTRCVCTDADHETSCHTPNKIRVHEEFHNRMNGMQRHDIVRMLGKPREFTLLSVKSMSFSDIDSRESNIVAGTPGGDTGELLNAIAVYERILRKPLSKERVRNLIGQYLSSLDEPLYFSTDEASLAHLQKHLHVDGSTGNVLTLDIISPDPDIQDEILADIVKPQNQGCLFFRSILQDPSRYYMREELVHNFFRALHEILWDKATPEGQTLSSKIKYNVFDGVNKAKAFVSFLGSHHCEEEDKTPGFAPRLNRGFGEVQVFVNHPHAVSFLRKSLARFFVGVATDINLTVAEYAALLTRSGNTNLELLAENLGPVPFYTVTVE